MQRITAVFNSQEELTEALRKIREDLQQGFNLCRIDKEVSTSMEKEKLVEQWQKMGQETGGLIGKSIGLGVTTGLKTIDLMAKGVKQAASKGRCMVEGCQSNKEDAGRSDESKDEGSGYHTKDEGSSYQTKEEARSRYQVVIEANDNFGQQVVEILCEKGAKQVTQDL